MERIGIAASKIAKGNLFLYNFYVLVITFLFSFLLFFIAGCVIVTVLVAVAYLTHPGTLPDLQKGWMPLMKICLACLAVVVGLMSFLALARNMKFKR
ncbi:MAG: hypothetical protein WC676_00805 [Candidatus Omnitrophota bacterium]